MAVKNISVPIYAHLIFLLPSIILIGYLYFLLSTQSQQFTLDWFKSVRNFVYIPYIAIFLCLVGLFLIPVSSTYFKYRIIGAKLFWTIFLSFLLGTFAYAIALLLFNFLH